MAPTQQHNVDQMLPECTVGLNMGKEPQLLRGNVLYGAASTSTHHALERELLVTLECKDISGTVTAGLCRYHARISVEHHLRRFSMATFKIVVGLRSYMT